MSGLSNPSPRPPQLVVDPAGLGDYLDLPTAIAAVPAGGATVLLKRGTYVLAATLTLPAKTILRGEGMLATIIQAPLTSANAVTINGADVALEDLQIDGRYASQTNGGGQGNQCGVYLNAGADRCRIRRCHIRDVCGMGISNVTHCDDLLVEGNRIANGGIAASAVQASPTPSTTVFAVAPGLSSRFAAGMSLRIGTQTGTVQSVSTINSQVAAVSSTSVFTVNSGDGALFSASQVIRVGPYSGTILSVVGDVITMTGALTQLPMIGQTVGIDQVTLTGALGLAPSVADVVAVTGLFQKGIYCALACNRPVIRNNYLTGWSQAIGLWFGVRDALVEGNQLVDNFGYEDAAHTVNRSALELFPSNNFGGRSRVIGNLITGTTHNCIECAQGEVGAVFLGNTLRHWAAENGLGATGEALEITGQSGLPGNTTDLSIIGNTIISSGCNASTGVQVGSFSAAVKIAANTFLGFSGATNSYPVSLQGDGASVVQSNTFNHCIRAIYVNSASINGGQLLGNQVLDFGTLSNAIDLAVAGDGWLIEGNAIEGNAVTGGPGILISSGNRHRIIGNRVRGSNPIQVLTADNLIQANYCEKNISNGKGCITVSTAAGLRNLLRQNVCIESPGNAIMLLASTAFNVVQDNQCPTSVLGDITNAGAATNTIEPNHFGTVVRSSTLKSLGAQTVNIAQVTIAHGLGYTPTQVLVTPTSNNTIWKSAASDAANVYLKASADGATAEVYVR